MHGRGNVRKILLLLVLTFPLFAQEATTTILVPTLYRGGGAFGSSWWSWVVLTNRSSVNLTSPGVRFGVACPIPEGCVRPEIEPQQSGSIISPTPGNGLLLHLPVSVAQKLAMQARFGQGTDTGANGTELPLVREDRFTRDPILFPIVRLFHTTTLQTPFRTSLRVYGVDAVPGTMVRVEVRHFFAPLDSPVLGSRVLTLDVPPSPAGVSRPIFPAFAQFTLQQEFPFDQLGGSAFAINVVPLPLPSGEVPRIWAFLSSTDNTTQEVVIHSPQ